MLRRLCLTFAIALSATPIWAQLVSTTVTTDMDGDGIEESFTLIETGEEHMDLAIDAAAQGSLTAIGTAWSGPIIGQQPELTIAPDGTVRVISMNDSVGRDRWKLSLTIAFVEGSYTITGYAYDWSDTRNTRAHGGCEVNLLTGEGMAQRGDREPRPFQSEAAALPVTEWRAETFMPDDGCLK